MLHLSLPSALHLAVTTCVNLTDPCHSVQSLEINPIDIVLDALQYSREAAIFYLVPNDGNVGDFQRAYELGLFEGHPRLKEGLQGIVIVLSCVPMLIRAMQACESRPFWTLLQPGQ